MSLSRGASTSSKLGVQFLGLGKNEKKIRQVYPVSCVGYIITLFIEKLCKKLQGESVQFFVRGGPGPHPSGCAHVVVRLVWWHHESTNSPTLWIQVEGSLHKCPMSINPIFSAFCVLQVLLLDFINTIWQLYIDFYTIRIVFKSSFQLCIFKVANFEEIRQFWQKFVDRTFVHVKHGAV